MNTTRIKPEEARAMVLAALRAHDYKGKTSELAQWTGLPSSVVRRAALYLASKNQIVSVLLPGPGRSRGEYLFHLQQLDLFVDHKPPATIWQKVKSWFR
jgi:hypothetical protein